ncbi:hypothetical protein ABLO26_25575 [Neobacillus sp. 179-J 1A1 HS]|uniref:hypothetical protein n=1 Tax=Neobacillus driksii TaxID=3035913 RepID=UPI0035BC1D29
MGLRCSCGVRTNPISTTNVTLTFVDVEPREDRNGILTLTIDACADRPDQSTLTAFVDQSGLIPNRSFTFTATDFEFVACGLVSGPVDIECRVQLGGIGLVTGQTTLFDFTFDLRNPESPLSDILEQIVIVNFANSLERRELQPALTFFGCPPTP